MANGSKATVSDKKSNVIVFTGGGTGGHIYPNLALIPEFEKRGFKAVYVGGDGGTMERKLAREFGVKYHGLPVIKLVRSISPSAISNNLKIPFTLRHAINEAKELLKKINPAAVFSKGGFVSLPVVIAASKLDIPTFAHESDLTAGLANRIAAKYGATMLKANPHAKFKGETVGMPLRDSLFSSKKSEARAKLNISTTKKVLLILGGSSGAKFLNDEVAKNISELIKKYFVLHVCGRGAFASSESPSASQSILKKNENELSSYMRFDYADNIADFYAASDIVVSRAGATAVYEISALKKRAVFVPLPKGVSRGDQIYNARLAEEYGAYTLCQNEQFSDNFLRIIEKAVQNPPMRALSCDANGKIADIVCASIGRGEKCKDKKLSQNGSQLSCS